MMIYLIRLEQFGEIIGQNSTRLEIGNYRRSHGYSRLGSEEFEIMKQHPAFSSTIMKPLMRFREYAEIAGSHHERWDGTGYPEGLAGEEIPFLARIVAIADAWDAMTGDRVYHKGLSVDAAVTILEGELKAGSGHFDPQLITEFIALIREEQASRTQAQS